MIYRITIRLLILSAAAMGTPNLQAQDMPLSQVLHEDEPWHLIGEGYRFTEAPAVDATGRLYFSDVPTGTIYRLNDDGKPEVFAQNAGNTSGLMFGPGNLLFACHYKTKQVVAYTPDGSFQILATLPSCNDLAVTRNGKIYVTDPASKAVWLLEHGTETEPRMVAENVNPNGVILWQDEGTLVITDSKLPVLRTYRIEADGSLSFGDSYYSPLQTKFGQEVPQSDGMTVDNDGRLYVATNTGIQMFDPTGRLGGTVAAPQTAFLSNVVFGGKDFRTLYVTSQDKVFARRVKPAGFPGVLLNAK